MTNALLGVVAQVGAVLFESPMSPQTVWKVPPATFADGAYRADCWKDPAAPHLSICSGPRPWAGNESWREYRVEVELMPEQGFSGLDFHVRNDGSSGASLHFFAADPAVQLGGRWGTVVAWKLLPQFSASKPLAAGEWAKVRVDVGESIANVYLNGESKATATFVELPFASGGVRPWAWAGSGRFRNLRVTVLEPGSVTPALGDPWAALKHPNTIRQWQVAGPYPAGYDAPPEAVSRKETKWTEARTDARGVLNLTALFPHENTAHVAYARAMVRSAAAGAQKAYVTYTDRFKLWCNGKLVFEGKPRGWFDPDREQLGNSRLIPDQFQVELPLKRGDNVILLRSEVTEPFGWGFWMRTSD